MMLKEVGNSGQISLGKKHAGKLYEVTAHADGRFELIPVRVVPTAGRVAPLVDAPDGWVPPGGYDGCTQWALDNREALEQHAAQVEQAGTAAEQLQRYLDEHPELLNDPDAKI
ncbi:MAG: hypothetical protein ACJ8HI_06510 [Massilia sp.]